MDLAQRSLPPFDQGEQTRLHGVSEVWIQPPMMALVADDPPAPVAGPGQLSLVGSNQQVLEPQPRQPQQLAMLPDPQPWEIGESEASPSATKGRLGRKRKKAGISAGQTTLF